LPFIFAGLNVAIVLSHSDRTIEDGGGRSSFETLKMAGTNSQMSRIAMQRHRQPQRMFAVLAVLALLEIVLYVLVRFLHVRLVIWAKPNNLRSGPN
jgi:hypothetical protein